MDIELSVMIIPTDRGVRVLGSCNEGYMNMISKLDELMESGHLANYTVPRARQRALLYDSEGTIDCSMLKYVHAMEGKSVLLYQQPYSESTLDRVVHELGRRYRMMKEIYQERGDLNNED